MSATFVPPPELRPLLGRLDAIVRGAGVAAHAVGGTVRDALLGRALRDIDVTVRGDALAVARGAADALGGHFVPMHEEHAVARIVFPAAADGAQATGAARHIDLTGYDGAIDADLTRRDFTVDALAAPLLGGPVIDLRGGLRDLRDGIVRMNAPDVFDADPLRLLRAVRLAAELRFAIEERTAACIRDRASSLRRAAAERQRDELARILELPDTYRGLRLLDGHGLLEVVLPEATAGRGVSQPGEFHAYDVFEHQLRAVEALDLMLARDGGAGWLGESFRTGFGDAADALTAYLEETLVEERSRRGLLKLAAVLHDIGKPATREETPDGRARFYGHAELGAEMSAAILRRLRFSGPELRSVSLLVAEHLRPVQLAQAGEAPTDRAIYRFCRDLGDDLPAVLLLSLADAASARGLTEAAGAGRRTGWTHHVAYMHSLLVRSQEERSIMQAPRLLTGHDIMSRFGVPEGPRIGALLEALREAQATGEVSDSKQAERFVRARLDEMEDGRT